METAVLTLQNQYGLHNRPATWFIQAANKFRSKIWIEKDKKRVDAKSLLGVLSLAIVGGEQIRIIAEGTDAKNAIQTLKRLVESKFDSQVVMSVLKK